MAVTVITDFGDVDTYDNATGWHIDEGRQLHVFKKVNSDSTSLGSYAAGSWRGVNVPDEVKSA